MGNTRQVCCTAAALRQMADWQVQSGCMRKMACYLSVSLPCLVSTLLLPSRCWPPPDFLATARCDAVLPDQPTAAGQPLCNSNTINVACLVC